MYDNDGRDIVRLIFPDSFQNIQWDWMIVVAVGTHLIQLPNSDSSNSVLARHPEKHSLDATCCGGLWYIHVTDAWYQSLDYHTSSQKSGLWSPISWQSDHVWKVRISISSMIDCVTHTSIANCPLGVVCAWNIMHNKPISSQFFVAAWSNFCTADFSVNLKCVIY